MKILKHKIIKDLGGEIIDELLLNDFIKRIEEKEKIKIKENKRLFVRLKNGLIKMKEKLSANGMNEV